MMRDRTSVASAPAVDRDPVPPRSSTPACLGPVPDRTMPAWTTAKEAAGAQTTVTGMSPAGLHGSEPPAWATSQRAAGGIEHSMSE